MTVSAAYYFLDVLRHRTRPQRSSWAVWAVTGVVGFGTADAGGAGPGAYAAAVDAIACLVTFGIRSCTRVRQAGRAAQRSAAGRGSRSRASCSGAGDR